MTLHIFQNQNYSLNKANLLINLLHENMTLFKPKQSGCNNVIVGSVNGVTMTWHFHCNLQTSKRYWIITYPEWKPPHPFEQFECS